MALSRKVKARLARRKRVRLKVLGTPEKPRLNIFRSARHIYVQLIDDTEARTLIAACSLSPELKDEPKGNIAGAKKVGELIAKKAVEKGITKVVFDRNGFKYHGQVKAVADAAREGGLKF